MTYTYNDQAIFQDVAGAKAIIRRPIGMSDKKWVKYADGVVKALDNRAPCTPLERGEAIHKAMLDDAQESPSMKLVDVLARELKVWPEGSLAATQDDGGQINHQMSSGTPVYSEWLCQWKAKPGNLLIFNCEHLTLSEDFKTAIVTCAEWQAAVDALKVAEGIADAEAGNLTPMGEVKNKWELRRNSRTLGGLIELGYLQPVHLETPTYDFSAWPPERFDCGLLPMKYPQFVGRIKRKIVIDPKPDHKECPEFLKSRIEHLNAYVALLKTNNQNLFDAGQTSSKQLADLSAKFADLKVELEERKEEAKQTIEFVVTPSALRALQIGIPVLRIRDDRKMIVRVGS